jgi:hypothetical protein
MSVCPVCGLGEYVIKHNESGSMSFTSNVSHLACVEKMEAERDEMAAMLRLAAADYWREQMDGLYDDKPVDHIIAATVEQWRKRVREQRP